MVRVSLQREALTFFISGFHTTIDPMPLSHRINVMQFQAKIKINFAA